MERGAWSTEPGEYEEWRWEGKKERGTGNWELGTGTCRVKQRGREHSWNGQASECQNWSRSAAGSVSGLQMLDCHQYFGFIECGSPAQVNTIEILPTLLYRVLYLNLSDMRHKTARLLDQATPRRRHALQQRGFGRTSVNSSSSQQAELAAIDSNDPGINLHCTTRMVLDGLSPRISGVANIVHTLGDRFNP